MSRIQVNLISNRLDDGPTELPNSAIIPSTGTLVVNGNLNVGVATINTVSATNLTASTITASSFIGNGSQLTGLPIVSQSKVIAFKYLIADAIPFRS